MAHGLHLSEDQIEKLVVLDQLLTRWNRAMALSALRSRPERFERYFAEPLHASLWAPRQGFAVDLGSGGGSPALPLAVALKETRFTLVESRRRKTVFLEEAIREIGVEARVLTARFEELTGLESVSLVTSRGLAETARKLDRIAAWLAPEGRVLLFTSVKGAQELRPPPLLEVLDTVRLAPSGRSRLVTLRCFT